MSSELSYLVWVVALTAMLWMPYILNAIMVRGLIAAVGYPQDPQPLAQWAARLKAAHYNAVENLVVFAPLVLVLNAAGISTETTVTACSAYFWARVVHAAAYTLAVPWVRTLAFLVGFGCQAVLVLQLL